MNSVKELYWYSSCITYVKKGKLCIIKGTSYFRLACLKLLCVSTCISVYSHVMH